MDEELKELLEEYKNACNMPTKPTWIKKLPSNHIEDENKSVKWNREFVDENNKKYQDAVADANRKRNLAMNDIRKKIERYIMKYAEVSEKGAKRIFEFAYSEGHSGGLYEVGVWIDQLIDLIFDCRE